MIKLFIEFSAIRAILGKRLRQLEVIQVGLRQLPGVQELELS